MIYFIGGKSFCLAITFACGIDVFANSVRFPDNPYAQIAMRNVFALDKSASVSSTTSNPAEPLPTIAPNGIMSVFGSAQTLFKVTDSQPDQPAGEKSYILGEGQREDGIEVVRIDEKNAVVTFNNHGTVQELPLVAASASGGYPIAKENVGQTGFSNPGTLHGNRISGNSGNATDTSGFGSGYADGAYKNNPPGQGLMVPNVSFASTSEGDNASVQALAVSNDVVPDKNDVAGQTDHISAAERLADMQMVSFARQHMQ